MITSELLDSEDQDELSAAGLTQAEKLRRVITKMIYKTENAFVLFLRILREDECNERIAEQIEQTDVTDYDLNLIKIGNH